MLHGGEDPQHRVEAFNDTLVALAVARGLCDPEDQTKPHSILPFADDMVRDAFPSSTLRRIWDDLERLGVEQSPLTPEATDDDLGSLVAAVQTGAHRDLDGEAGGRFRRYATHMLDALRTDEE